MRPLFLFPLFFFGLFFLPLQAMENQQSSSVFPVILKQRFVTEEEAGAGSFSLSRIHLTYGYIFNVCNSLLQKEPCMREEKIVDGDYEIGWHFYHKYGHSFSGKLLENIFAWGLLNFYIQKSLGLAIDLNVASDLNKASQNVAPNAFTTKVSLWKFFKPQGSSREERADAVGQGIKRYKFLLGDAPQKIPAAVIHAGAFFQRYKIVLEKYSTMVDYNEYEKLNDLLNILQRFIIDFVDDNKEVIEDFLMDTTIIIDGANHSISDHEIMWQEKNMPADVLQLLTIPELIAPFPNVSGEDFTNEVKKRLGYFKIDKIK